MNRHFQATLKYQEGEPISGRRRLIALASVVLFVAVSQDCGLAQSRENEVRSAVAEILRSPNRQPVAASRAIEALVEKHGREVVADTLFEPLTTALKGTNYAAADNAASMLFVLKDPGFVGPLIEFLHVEKNGDMAAEQALVAIGEPTLNPLIAAFKSGASDRHFQFKAAKVLGELKDARAVGPLLEVFAVRDPSLPWVCAEALGKIGGTEAVDGLVATLKSGTIGMKANAAEALGQTKDPRAVPALVTALEEPERAVRSEAARALGEISDPASIDGLIKVLTDPGSRVEGEASRALSRLRNSGATEAMLRHFRDAKNQEERDCLLRALAGMGEPAVEVMLEMLKDDAPEIRQTALRQLSAMSTEGYVVAQGIAESTRERARNAIMDFYEAGKADAMPFPERISILAAIKEPRAVRLMLRILKTKEEGCEDCPWYVPPDLFYAFEKAGSWSVEPLMEALDEPDASIRAGAAALLGHIPVQFHGTNWQVSAASILDRLGKVAGDGKEHEAVREKAIGSISRIGDARQAPVVITLLLDKKAPVPVRRAAARALVGENLQTRSVTASLLMVLRDRNENQFLRVDVAEALRGFEHKFHDVQIAETFKSLRMDRNEPAAVRASARTVQEMFDKIKRQSAAPKGGLSVSSQDMPYGKKVWPKSSRRNGSQVAERTVIELQAEGERLEVRNWYDAQFADWKVHKDWNSREIAVMMNGEWKTWFKSNACCLIVVHEKERRGGMTVTHAVDREEEIQDLVAEIPEQVAHRERCKRNLQAIESAISQATRQFKLSAGSVVEAGQISALIPGGLESLVCPDAGMYAIGAVGKASRCSVHGTQIAMGRR